MHFNKSHPEILLQFICRKNLHPLHYKIILLLHGVYPLKTASQLGCHEWLIDVHEIVISSVLSVAPGDQKD